MFELPAKRWMVLALLAGLLGCAAGKRIVLSPAELVALGERRLEAGHHLKARTALERCRSDFPASPEATRSQILIADSFFDQRRFEEAAVEYRLFLDFHPASDAADYALYHLALCRYHRNPGPDRDLTIVEQGVEDLERLVRLYPDSEHLPDAEARLAELRGTLLDHELHVARFYLKTHRWSGAIARYRRIQTLTRDPDILAEAEAGLARALPFQERADERRAAWEEEREEMLAREEAQEEGASGEAPAEGAEDPTEESGAEDPEEAPEGSA